MTCTVIYYIGKILEYTKLGFRKCSILQLSYVIILQNVEVDELCMQIFTDLPFFLSMKFVAR
jgi:hypothetical protein